MADNKRCFSGIERRALGLLAQGWEIRNAQGPVRANSILTDGRERLTLGRSTMARLRDLGLISYVRGSAALAVITDAGRRAVLNLQEDDHEQSPAPATQST